MIRILLFCMVLSACGGSVPDEQRRALKKELEERKVKKISEDEIFQKAFEMGRGYVRQLEKHDATHVARTHEVSIVFADSSTSTLSKIQKDIYEAYAYVSGSDQATDNVQIEGDTIIYSAPVIEEGQLKGIWLINIPKKKVVLAL